MSPFQSRADPGWQPWNPEGGFQCPGPGQVPCSAFWAVAPLMPPVLFSGHCVPALVPWNFCWFPFLGKTMKHLEAPKPFPEVDTLSFYVWSDKVLPTVCQTLGVPGCWTHSTDWQGMQVIPMQFWHRNNIGCFQGKKRSTYMSPRKLFGRNCN